MMRYCSGVPEQKLDQLHEQQQALSALKRALKHVNLLHSSLPLCLMRQRCLFTLFTQPLKQAMSQSRPLKDLH